MTGLAREYGEGLYELARDEDLRPQIHQQLQEISDLLTTLLVEKAKTAQLGTKQATVNYPMIKADGVWKIEELPEGAMHVVTSDLLRAAAAMAEAISDAD